MGMLIINIFKRIIEKNQNENSLSCFHPDKHKQCQKCKGLGFTNKNYLEKRYNL